MDRAGYWRRRRRSRPAEIPAAARPAPGAASPPRRRRADRRRRCRCRRRPGAGGGRRAGAACGACAPRNRWSLRAYSWILLFGKLPVLEIAIGLGRYLHDQRIGTADAAVAAALAVARSGIDREVLQRRDAREARDVADEVAELVIVAGHLDLDRKLGVEVLGPLRLGPEQLELEPVLQAGLGYVHEQFGNLGPARQLAQHGSERAAHLLHLLPVGVEVRGLCLLGDELLLEGGLLCTRLLELLELDARVEPEPAAEQRPGEQYDGRHLDRLRPPGDVVEVDLAELREVEVQVHASSVRWVPSAPGPTWLTLRRKREARDGSLPFASMTSSRGPANEGEASRLRMKA